MNNKQIRNIIYTALSAGLLCVLSPFALPLGVIPITLCTFIIFLVSYINKPKTAIISVLLYIILGAAGLPVFSGFSSGIWHILSPSGGFIFGYIPMSMLLCFGFRGKDGFVKRMAVTSFATLLLYFCGITWYMLWINADIRASVMFSFVSFIPGDLIKIMIFSLISPKIKQLVNK